MNKLFSPWWLLLLAVAGAAALALVYVGTLSLPFHAHAEKLGQMGDFFGGLLNPLVSLLTLFVAISVWQLQREELKLTRDELEQTKLAMKDQAKTAEQQRQEQRFFDLLNVYQQSVNSIFVVARMPSKSGEFPVQYTGKEAIAQVLRRGDEASNQLRAFNKHSYVAWTSDFIQVTAREQLIPFWCNETTASFFDHYFRVVFRILSEAEALLTDQHFRYIKLFRAQLSRSELSILGFNLWLDEEGEKMIPLAKKYGLLKHLPSGHLRNELEKLHPQVFGRTRAQSLQALSPTQPEASL